MRNLKTFILLLLLAVSPALAAKITNGEQLVAAMRQKYDGKWYKTLTFVQKSTTIKPDGSTSVETWYEAMSVPGKLRVDIAPVEAGKGVLFFDNTQHVFNNSKLERSQPLIHPLLVLGFDVYGQPADVTVKQLKDLGFDLSNLHEETWQGREVYVVGAKAGDLTTPQFWVDKKNLYFVRLFQKVGKDKNRVQETQFNKYQKVKGGGWVAPEVVFFIDGRKYFLEEYSDIQTDVKLDEKLFDPQKWAEADKTYYQIKKN
ncbi:MAG TPA: hypothetical protein VIL74_11890 [Pyrinomonadaceae bacterium]|jgi:outer membrane lipoprotein-sorting protein